MSETITASLTVSGGDVITAEINTLARGPAGPPGASGASTWDDITGTASDVPFLPVAAPVHSEGLLFYDSTDKSLTYYNDEADVSMNIGREMWVRVRNNSGAQISNGKVVYINDALGQLPTIRLARADSATTSRVIGIATHDIGNNEFGYVTSTGEIKGLNTIAYNDGDALYLSAVTAGEMTTTAPTAPNRTIQVATVLHAHVSQGKLYCHPENDSVASTGIVDSTATGRALITAATQSDARTTGLGSGATGDALFTAVSASAARTTLELGAFSTNGSITGTGALTFTSAAASNINLTPGTTGFIDIAKASATGVRESILRAKISDAGDDAFQIYNGTSADGRFSPGFGGAVFSNPGTFGLLFNAVTNAANDTGTTPMMLFAAGRTSSTSDPFNGTFADVITRPLFRWQTSGNNLIAEISAARNLSIFTTTASTSTTTGALIVSGGVGVAGAVNVGGGATVAGNVGIGTSTPAAVGKLTVAGDTAGAALVSIVNSQGRGITIRPAGDGGSVGGAVFSEAGPANGFRFAGSVRPETNITSDLGTPGIVWLNVYARNIRGRSNSAEGDLNLRSGHVSRPLTFGIDTTEHARVHTDGNVGIGAPTPASKLTVTGGDAEVTDATKGLILKTPDGTKRYRVTIDNAGALTTTLL